MKKKIKDCTFKEFTRWANARACDGRWSMLDAVNTVSVISMVYEVKPLFFRGKAIKMHKANHPNTMHYCENVWAVDPVKACKEHPVGLAWFSPDCKHFSKAKGGKPKDKNIRGLAWVACRWAGLVRPRVIMLENVEEFKTWGPLNRGHHPIKSKQGKTFEKFVQQLNDLGYEV